MLNLPQQLAPLKWGDFFGHTREQHIILRSLAGGSTTMPNSMFITGPTGTGKTSLVNLITRSLLCSNPQDYTLEGQTYEKIDPCGECDYCRSVIDFRQSTGDSTNVMLIQPGASETDTLNALVKRSLEIAHRPPVGTGNSREDYRVLVYDEWQCFSKPLRQQVLLKAELDVSGLNVIYFFLTMSEDELPLEDRIAMMSRGLPIRLRGLSADAIKEYLLKVTADLDGPKLNEPEAYQIALRSRNSIRMALAHYERLAAYDHRLEYIQPETAQYFLNYTHAADRVELWRTISRGVWTGLAEVLNRVSSLYDPTKLDDLALDLIKDITAAMTDGHGRSEHQLLGLRIMYQFLANHATLKLDDYLLQLNGLELGVI